MNAPNPPPPDGPPDLTRLRRRFVALMVVQGVLGAVAVAFATAYFALDLAWGLPAFAVALGAAVVAQVWFIWMFRQDRG